MKILVSSTLVQCSEEIPALNDTMVLPGGVGQAPSARDKINIPQYSAQGYTRTMRKQQTTNSSSAEVCRGALGRSCSIDSYRTLNT